ncbi:dolichol kinase-like [Argonauta hians]
MDVGSSLEAMVVGAGCSYVLYSLRSYLHPGTILMASSVFCWSVCVERMWKNYGGPFLKKYFRPKARSSTWSILIFPLCLWSLVPSNDPSAHCVTIGLLLLASPVYLASRHLLEPAYLEKRLSATETLAHITVGAAATWLSGKGYLECCVLASMLVCHLYLMKNLVLFLPKTFTFGEVALVSQLTVYFVHRSIMILMKTAIAGGFVSAKQDVICAVVAVVMVTSGAVFHISSSSSSSLDGATPPPPLSPMTFYGTYIAMATTIITTTVAAVAMPRHRTTMVATVVELLLGISHTQVYLLGYWILWSALTVAVVTYFSANTDRVHYDVRKYFHIVMVGVYLPGLLLEPTMLALAAWGAFAFLFLLEQIRMYQIPPLSSMLQSSLTLFLDEKDSGPMLVSHIYLLLGFSLPIWLSTHSDNTPMTKVDLLSSFAGLLTLGVGDAVASVIGTRYGTRKLPGGTKKSVEGTTASVIAQMLCLAGLDYFVAVPVSVRILFTVVMASLYEAFTDQIDNLALPLFTYPLLRLAL